MILNGNKSLVLGFVLEEFNACIMATLLSTVIAVLVSLVTPKTPYGIIKTWFGKIQQKGVDYYG